MSPPIRCRGSVRSCGGIVQHDKADTLQRIVVVVVFAISANERAAAAGLASRRTRHSSVDDVQSCGACCGRPRGHDEHVAIAVYASPVSSPTRSRPN